MLASWTDVSADEARVVIESIVSDLISNAVTHCHLEEIGGVEEVNDGFRSDVMDMSPGLDEINIGTD